MAGVLQYIVPFLALVGAVISLLKSSRRRGLLQSAANSGSKVLTGISWQEFEVLVGEAFRRKGYSVEESGGGGADGGVDLILRKDGEKVLVQCKQWRAYKVGVKAVRELYGVMAATGASHGYVVISGRFTEDAVRFATGREIDLIDGEKLNRLIRAIKHERKVVIPKAGTAVQEGGGMVLNISIPACPKCGSSMVKRMARKGERIGRQFWGCRNYPRCMGVRPL